MGGQPKSEASSWSSPEVRALWEEPTEAVPQNQWEAVGILFLLGRGGCPLARVTAGRNSGVTVSLYSLHCRLPTFPSCATLLFLWTPSPRSTIFGWGVRVPLPPDFWNRTVTAPLSTPVRAPRSRLCTDGSKPAPSAWAISTPFSLRTSTWTTPVPRGRWSARTPASLCMSTDCS